jgi:hypothetical protein
VAPKIRSVRQRTDDQGDRIALALKEADRLLPLQHLNRFGTGPLALVATRAGYVRQRTDRRPAVRDYE